MYLVVMGAVATAKQFGNMQIERILVTFGPISAPQFGPISSNTPEFKRFRAGLEQRPKSG